MAGLVVLIVRVVIAHRLHGNSARRTGWTTGKIIGHERQVDNEGVSVTLPIVEFTLNGETYSKQSSHGFSPLPSKFRQGAEVRIHFNPHDPRDADIVDQEVSSQTQLLLTYLLLAGTALIVAGIGWVVSRSTSSE
jgi:hypothetical protein